MIAVVVSSGLLIAGAASAAEIDHRAVAEWQLGISSHELPGARLGKAAPMYNPALEGVPFMEHEVLSADGATMGYIIVSTTTETVPVVEYSETTPPHLQRFAEMLGHTDFRMVYYGLVYVVAEGPGGELLAEIGERPPVLKTDLTTYDGPTAMGLEADASFEPVEIDAGGYPLDYHWTSSYEELREAYQLAGHLTSDLEQRWERVGQEDLEYTYYYVSGTKCYWGQIQSATCYTGCGPTAWTNAYGWWEKAKGKGNLFSGSPDTCTINYAVSDVIWDIVGYVGTYCIGNNGATNPWSIYKGYKHADAKGYGWYYWWHWRVAGFPYTTEAEILRQSATRYRMAIVGYYDDWHYGAGYYYKLGSSTTDVQVSIITGWGCNNTKWVYASDTLAVVDFEVR
jgi:NADH:ubiquinone oxidoreductase subunit